MDTKKLRQKILDLAIRGKLVPQDPNDEPASVLLERIRAEKEQLIKEGKIKRSKKSAASDTSHYENVPFEVPESWCWTTIGELFQLQAGKFIEAPQISTCKDATHIYPCYGGNGLRGYVESYNRDGLFPIIGRQGALCGNINIAEGKFYATEHAVVVETFANIDIQLFVYFLIQLNLNQYATATAQPGLAVKTINEVPIPLPPINEQHRISMAIEKSLDTLSEIDQSKHAIRKSILQLKSRILDLAISGKLAAQDCSDEPALELLRRINPSFAPCDNRHYTNVPFSLPDTWLWASGKDLFLPMKNCKPSGEYFKYIDIDSLDNQDCVVKCPKVLPVTAAPSRATRCTKVGDILFSMVRPYLKNIAMITESDCIASTGFYVCSPNKALLSKYCYYLMISPYVINGLSQFMKGDNSPSINNVHISDWLYPLPPLNEQKRIVKKVDEVFRHLDSIVTEL